MGSGDDEDDSQPFKHKDHEYANHDAKATTGEMFDFKNEMFIKHAILQAQVDALTKNIEALCKAQGVNVAKATKPSLDYAELYNESGMKMFDETTGKRLTTDEGKAITKCWFPTEPEESASFSNTPAQEPQGKLFQVGETDSKVHPDVNGDSGESHTNSNSVPGVEEGC